MPNTSNDIGVLFDELTLNFRSVLSFFCRISSASLATFVTIPPELLAPRVPRKERCSVLRVIQFPPRPAPLFQFSFVLFLFRCYASPLRSKKYIPAKGARCGWFSRALEVAWQATILGFEIFCFDCQSKSLGGCCTTWRSGIQSKFWFSKKFYMPLLSPLQLILSTKTSLM